MKGTMKTLAVLLLAVSALAAQTTHSVSLNWGASSTPSVTYNVYRSTASGSGYSQINVSPVAGLTFTDSQVTNGTTYFYVVRSFDGTSESVNSNQATAVIPQAPQPPGTLTVTVK
jgi:hypothetical protein